MQQESRTAAHTLVSLHLVSTLEGNPGESSLRFGLIRDTAEKHELNQRRLPYVVAFKTVPARTLQILQVALPTACVLPLVQPLVKL